MAFLDRADAGRQLAAQLMWLAPERPIVLALPRGGVPVAFEVARALGAPLEVLAVRKLGAPQNPEMAVGAVAEDGTTVLNASVVREVGLTQGQLDRILEREQAELQRRIECFRGGRAPPAVRGRTVVIADDGLATGATDLVAVRAVRRAGAARVVVGVPVGSDEAVASLRAEADAVVCVEIPAHLHGAGRWYRDFAPVTDAQVLALLAAAGSSVGTP